MFNTPTSGTSHPASPIQRLTSKISHLATSTIIQLLTTAIKFRKAGLISLLAFSLINCYFMLFDQQAYITFLEYYGSPDGHISDINSVFFNVQIVTIFTFIFWTFIDQPSIDLIKERSLRSYNSLAWRQRPLPYIIACCMWLLISYTPFLFLDSKTIIRLIQEDGFFQNCGAFFLFAASVMFFFLFYQSKEKEVLARFSKGRNIWFLLLGLLFLFGAGEEISWGQRIFHFKTPEFMSSNIQGEFTIHNLPWFDGRIEKPHYNNHGNVISKPKTSFLEIHLTAGALMFYFCFLSFIILPIIIRINHTIKEKSQSIRLPIPPLYLIVFFFTELFLVKKLTLYYHTENLQSNIEGAWTSVKTTHLLNWAVVEIHETFISFLFMITALWLANQPQKLILALTAPSTNKKQT